MCSAQFWPQTAINSLHIIHKLICIMNTVFSVSYELNLYGVKYTLVATTV